MGIDSLAAIVRTWGADRPDAPAIEFDGRTITYGELDERSSRLANALAAAGVGPQDHVAFIDKNGPEFFDVSFAVGKLNAITVAVNWRLAPTEMAYIVNDARAKVLIVGPDFVPHVEKIEDELTGVTTIVAIGGHARWEDYERWLERAAGRRPRARRSRPTTSRCSCTRRARPGLPKGVMLTNSQLLRDDLAGRRHRGASADDSVNLAVMPMFHIAGSGWATVGLVFGCRTVLLRDVDPARILQVIPEFGVTNALFVPAVIQFLLMTPDVDDTDFTTLRAIVYGASPITDATLTKAVETFGCDFIQVYGLTETTGAITQLDAADHDPVGPAAPPAFVRAAVPVGRAAGGRPRDGRGRARSERSASCGRAARQNMKGYWNNPEATAAAVTEDGWFKTGDAGYLDADGFIFLHDRVKDMIVSGGENIYPAEVENVLAKHPDVADVAVIGVPDDRWGEAVKAVVVRREGSESTEADAHHVLPANTSPATSCPKSVDFADVLPRNPSGKLLKRELREPYWEGRERRVN